MARFPTRLLLASALFVAPAAALAHPHIFIDAKAVIVFDGEGRVAGIRHAWTFDEAFSVWQVQGLDTNSDGVTSPAEMQELANENMAGLAEYSFYTFAGEGEENLELASGINPSMQHAGGRTTLEFDVALARPHAIGDRLEIAVNDPEYYVAITFDGPGAVSLENAPPGCAAELQPPRELAPELAEQLYALPPEVTELPPELATALRGVQGAIVVSCDGTRALEGTALDAITAVGTAPSTPFGGPPAEPGIGMPRTGFLGWVAQQQTNFYASLTSALGRLKQDQNAFWVLGALSFLYGVFHAAGPGHGKVVISSYVLANERQVRRGIVLSFLAAMLQSAVAVGFVLIAAAALNLTSTAMGEAANWIGIASYALVALLGLWLLLRKLFGFGHDHRRDHKRARTHLYGGEDHSHAHAQGHEHHDDDEQHHHVLTPQQLRGHWREQAAVVLGVGLRPCSGALVVLVFALSQGLLGAGIASVFLMGLGTALTVAVLATMAVSLKGLAARLSGAGAGRAGAVMWWLELGGAVAVLAFGLVLLLAAI